MRKNSDFGSIQFNPQLGGGKAIFSGTGLTVDSVLDEIAKGYDTKRILKEHPNLSLADIDAAKRYAVQRHVNIEQNPRAAFGIGNRSEGVSTLETKGNVNLNRALSFRTKK